MLGSTASLNDLIGSREHRGWDREAERFRDLQIDDQLELRGLLDRKIAGVGAPEDFVDIGSDAPQQIGEVWAIGHEAAGLHGLTEPEDHWQPVFRREGSEPPSMGE
jgi:hypothetical protein